MTPQGRRAASRSVLYPPPQPCPTHRSGPSLPDTPRRPRVGRKLHNIVQLQGLERVQLTPRGNEGALQAPEWLRGLSVPQDTAPPSAPCPLITWTSPGSMVALPQPRSGPLSPRQLC